MVTSAHHVTQQRLHVESIKRRDTWFWYGAQKQKTTLEMADGKEVTATL